MSRFVAAAVAIALLSLATACSGHVDEPAPPLSVLASSASLSCMTNGTTTLGLTISGGRGTPVVTFAAHDANVSVTGSGASASVVCGTTTGSSAVDYRVTSGDQIATGSVPVAITAPRLDVTPSATSLVCVAGQRINFSLTISGPAGQGRITFLAQTPAVSVTISGIFASIECGLEAGTSGITWTVESGGQTVSGTVPIVIVPALVVTPTPSAISCNTGSSATLTLAVTGGVLASAPAVSFAARSAVASVSAIGSVATIVCGAAAGSTSIDYTVTSGTQTVSGSVPVTVSVPPPPPPLVVTPVPTSVACHTGQTATIALAIAGGVGTPNVAFAATTADVTVSTSGAIATIVCGASAATSAVRYTVTSGAQTVSGSVPVSITVPVPPLTVTATPAAACWSGERVPLTLVALGGSGALTATFVGDDAITFASTDIVQTATTATVTITCVAPGSASVRWTARRGAETVTGVIPIEISSPIARFDVSPSAMTLPGYGFGTISAVVTLAPGAPPGTSTAVTFRSSNPAAATVSPTGLVTPNNIGTTIITVSPVAMPSLQRTVSVDVPFPVRLLILGLQADDGTGTLVQVNPNNVSGTLYVPMALDPGGFSVDSVLMLFGGQRIPCPKFWSGPGSGFANGVCAIDTKRIPNGIWSFAAVAYYRGAGTPTVWFTSSTVSNPLLVNNP